MRNDVAEYARKVFLHVPAQVAQERKDLGRKAGVAGNVHRTHEVLLAFGQRSKNLRLGGDHQRGLAPGFCRRGLAALGDRQPHGRQRRKAQLDKLAGEGREFLPRPRFAAEEVVERRGDAGIKETHLWNRK